MYGHCFVVVTEFLLCHDLLSTRCHGKNAPYTRVRIHRINVSVVAVCVYWHGYIDQIATTRRKRSPVIGMAITLNTIHS